MAESECYWTGRFVAICDKLRSEEHAADENSTTTSNRNTDEAILDAKDKMRMRTASNILRTYCRTAEALQSFESFDRQLCKKLGIHHNTGALKDRVSLPGEDNWKIQRSNFFKVRKLRSMPQSPNLDCTTISRVSSLDMEANSSSFYGQGALTKSKTTGNLASILPLIHKKTLALTTSYTQKSINTHPKVHQQKTSYFDCSPEMRAKALRERETRAARRVAEVKNRSETHTTKTTNLGTNQVGLERVLSAPSIAPKHRRVSSFIIATPQSSNGLGANFDHETPKGERGESSLPSPTDRRRPKDPQGGVVSQEDTFKLRRRPERHFSGEIMKNFFEAGLREVRRMDRRVSGGMA